MYPVKIGSIHSKVRSLIILLSFIVTSKGLSAQTNEPCFNPAALKNICMFIDSRSKVEKPVLQYEYTFIYKLFSAACVDPAVDSEEVIAQKIRRMWLKYEDQLVCNSMKFDTTDGNIIKFAVAQTFDDLIYYVTKWGVNLNRVDKYDKRTVLDYIQFQINKNKGTAIEGTLQNYFKRVRQAGGKFASEL